MEHPLEKFVFCPVCGSRHWVEHNVKSKCCGDCGFVYYANPCSATVAFMVRPSHGAGSELEMLVVRRAKEPAKGTLDLPGGFVDMYETAEEGMRREIMEETGLQVDTVSYQFSIPNLYLYSGMTIHTLDMFYLVNMAPDAVARAADDAAECMWLPLSQVRPEEFGLQSIGQGVTRFLQENS